jgi:hypothetical protein
MYAVHCCFSAWYCNCPEPSPSVQMSNNHLSNTTRPPGKLGTLIQLWNFSGREQTFLIKNNFYFLRSCLMCVDVLHMCPFHILKEENVPISSISNWPVVPAKDIGAFVVWQINKLMSGTPVVFESYIKSQIFGESWCLVASSVCSLSSYSAFWVSFLDLSSRMVAPINGWWWEFCYLWLIFGL